MNSVFPYYIATELTRFFKGARDSDALLHLCPCLPSAWLVDFDTGTDSPETLDKIGTVRLVRGGV